MSLSFKDKKSVTFAVALLLLLKGLTQFALYQAGFTALTADEFGRTLTAARWIQHPGINWHDAWLPFHAYLFGAALLFKWELLWVPRLLTLCSGFLSIVVMYLLTSSLFKNNIAGLISALLLSVNPAHIWLSATPLTEMPNTLCILAGVWAFGLYLENAKRGDMFLAAGALALAGGFRFESWLLSSIFSIILLVQGVMLVRKKAPWGNLLPLGAALLILWIFPLGWLTGNYLAAQNPFDFLNLIRSYQLQWYGTNLAYDKYFETFWKLDPYVAVLGVFSVALGLLRHKKNYAIWWYSAAALILPIIFMLLSGGQNQPPGTYIRYMAPFTFLFYPALGYLLAVIGARLRQINGGLQWVVALFLGVIITTQFAAAFRFKNDPAGEGLAVGLALRELRAQSPAIAQRPVVIELAYWQYLAIIIGANDINRVIYDRELDIYARTAQSLLLTDETLFKSCLRVYDISYLVIKDPGLRATLEGQWHLQPIKEVNGYAFYFLEADFLQSLPAAAATPCPPYFAPKN